VSSPRLHGAVWVLLVLSCVLAVSACGNAGPRVTHEQARSLATKFVDSIFNAPSTKVVGRRLRTLTGQGVINEAIDGYSGIFRYYDERVFAGPRAGCPADPAGRSSGRPCYSFCVVGGFRPDPINKGYAVIGVGMLSVRIKERGSPAQVDAYSYAGGGRECQLNRNCHEARRELIQRAKHFQC
jgi:hypothetical protein